MMLSIFLSIQLIPHYLIMAAIVIAVHWLWIFSIRKGKHHTNTFSSYKGYQTGGSHKNFSSQLHAQQEESIISKPSLPRELFAVNPEHTIQQHIDASSEEIIPSKLPAKEQENDGYLYELTKEQAEFDLVTALKFLAEGKLDTEEVKVLNEIAGITIATDQQYPHVAEEVKDILTFPAIESKDIPFIN